VLIAVVTQRAFGIGRIPGLLVLAVIGLVAVLTNRATYTPAARRRA
jgi:hypothetical protein